MNEKKEFEKLKRKLKRFGKSNDILKMKLEKAIERNEKYKEKLSALPFRGIVSL